MSVFVPIRNNLPGTARRPWSKEDQECTVLGMATTSALSKEEYLKKYLSGGNDETRKKKKKKKLHGVVKSSRNMIIHDDDIDVKKLTSNQKEDIVDKLNVDEAPLVADIVDERPLEEIQLEQFRKSNKWKLMNKDKDEKEPVSSSKQRGSDSDLSPARGRQHRHDSDSDQSPPRRHQTKEMPKRNDLSPSRQNQGKKTYSRSRHDSDSDMSPPRRARHDSDSDMSPPRRTPHDSDSDMSPPRRTHHDSDSMSPPRRTCHDSDSDLSPPRKSKQKRHNSDSDLSPPRKSTKKGSDSDLSPPRRGKSSKVTGGDRQLKGKRSQRGQDSDSDLSPPRRGKLDKPRLDKMSSGAKAGLQDARTMRRENEATRKRNTEMFSHMTNEMSGKNAETVFRDRSSGRRRDLKMEKLKQREEEQKKAEEDEKFMEWGKGLIQKKQRESAIQDHIHEMAKPMARYRDDQDLDAMLKEQDREGDPMLAFLKKKQAKKNLELGIKEKPKYKGPTPPPNRFNIMPGYRWDGVDRSNGFEKKFFIRNADKKAMSEVAYKWSVEDM